MFAVTRLLISSFTLAAACGCTSVSFKQGAGGEEFRRAEATCRSTTSEQHAFAQCMEAKGWWTRSMEELSQLGFVSADTEMSGEAADVPSSTTAAAGTAAPGMPLPADRNANVPVPKDPLSRVRIAMWSKAGANGAALMTDQSACVAGLGEAHQPDPLAGTVTRALYDCLRKQGWTGLSLR